ncbi:MAG: phenylalanine--tRNA ligase subunit beta [Firmicutes bacterium]|jgi:phenylalanyl-tRNA synthetase beta chain|nr:phenylalanine--tRNA ligase subunit beta [Bacillota bacterium]
MLVSLNWLRDYVDIPWAPEELADRLTMAGLEVEGITYLNPGLDNVRVGRILHAAPHPNGEELYVCNVDVGDGEALQIVCGAPNTAAGQIVAVALPGAVLPGGFTIESREIRGVVSHGMICSEKELGIGEDESGILVLPEEAEVGRDLAKALFLDDVVLDISIYANRPDCMSMLGIAREVAALTGGKLRYPDLDYAAIPARAADHLRVEVLDTKYCPRYTALMVQRVKVGQSPLWMHARLRAAGMRPINNVVDITNYVMLELGQPLHAFDYAKLAEGRIEVRLARSGERLVTLDGQERELSEEMLMICDGAGPVCIAGVMGGSNSEVTDATKTIVLESANFNPVSVRRTSKRLGIASESAARFEKGIDPTGTLTAAQRAAHLMAKYAEAEVLEGVLDVDAANRTPKVIPFQPARAYRLLGTEIPESEMEKIFSALDFTIHKGENAWFVTVPSHRRDIELEADLVEEVARIWGYDKIPTTVPFGVTMVGGQSRAEQLADKLRAKLVGFGIQEALTYSFISPDSNARLQVDTPVEMMRIANPISEELACMRTSLLPGLLTAVSTNSGRQQSRVALFEIGAVYLPESGDLLAQPREPRRLGIVLYGQRHDRNWAVPSAEYDFYDVKGILESLLVGEDLVWTKGQSPTFHPFRQGEVSSGGRRAAVYGEIHPNVARNFRISGRVYAAEVDLEVLLEHDTGLASYREISRYPRIDRDLAILVDRERPAADILEAIKHQGGELLQEAAVFDVYQGKQVPEGKKSVAFSLQFQANRTLKEAEVNEIMERIIASLRERFGAEIR